MEEEEEDYAEALAEDLLAEGKLTPATVDGLQVCLLRSSGRIFGFSNVCGHVGGRISDGRVGKQTHVICPIHKAVFDVTDGASLSSFAYRGLKVYDIKIKNGKILVSKKGREPWRDRQKEEEEAAYNKSSLAC